MNALLSKAAMVAGGAIVLVLPAEAHAPALAMLDRLDQGRWEVRARGGDEPVERLCLHDGRRLIQLRHPTSICERLVLEDGPAEVTVQYTCRGQGYGRTRIRRETSQLVQIDSQGIADGLPFAFAAEARRIGGCD